MRLEDEQAARMGRLSRDGVVLQIITSNENKALKHKTQAWEVSKYNFEPKKHIASGFLE